MSLVKGSSRLYNEDLAPVPPERRTWGMWSIAALWIGMSVCITTYMLAAGMIEQGMNWRQAMFTILLGNLIVLIPMLLNGHPGTRYGIPFPVLVRASFGTRGSNVPALMRAVVACGWFGIQTWIGGMAIYTLLSVMIGFTPAGPELALPILGISAGQFLCFLFFWAVNMAVVLAGIESIKWLERLAAPFLIATGLALLAWGIHAGGGLSRILADETVAQTRSKLPVEFNFWTVFWPMLTATVGYWATLSLNISDFTRYARSQRDQALGQLLGMPTTMGLFSFVGIAVTGATVVVFGAPIWDPVALLGKFDSPVVIGLALLTLAVATLTTNIAANVVSPANDFSNVAPRVISFKMGGILTGVIGVLIMPWRLLTDLQAYVFTWLIGYSSLLGAIAGVMLADYYVVRRTRLDAAALYSETGEYSYGGRGYNWRAMVALVAGILPNVPGFLNAASNGSIDAPPFFKSLYPYAWFVSLLLAAGIHMALTAMFPRSVSAPYPASAPGTLEEA